MVGELVDVTGVSKGKGFTGVMKRHNFSGQNASHGAHKVHRKPGAVGQCATPSRIFRGKRMPGRAGAEKVTTLNLQVVRVDSEQDLILLKGSVPGRRGATVLIRSAVKNGAKMTTVTVRNPAGKKTGSVDLDPEVFGIEPNMAVLHQVVTAQLAARRRGTQSTKTKSEVKGGGGKPWRQKGTGRARHGSTRNPQWRGGGVALGPKPRSYRQHTPKKMIRLALRSALSDRARDDKVMVVDSWTFEAPRTKEATAALDALGVDGRVLIVDRARTIRRCGRASTICPRVHLISPGELNAYDVLVSDVVVFTLDTLPTAAPSEQESEAAEEGDES